MSIKRNFVLPGMVSTSMQPIFAHLVDIRHAAVYGNVYAISDMAVCLAMSVGRYLLSLFNDHLLTNCTLKSVYAYEALILIINQ